MTALAKSRSTPRLEGRRYRFPVAASVLIYSGALVVVNASGYAKPGVVGTALRAVGIASLDPAEGYVDNSAGAAGDKYVIVYTGIYAFKNSAGADEITAAELGQTVYIVDDQTVAKTSDTNARSPAGSVRMIEGGLIYVDIGMPSVLDGDLVASNNLSDVASAATARSNLGANKVVVAVHVETLVGTGVTRVVSPVAGTVSKIWSVIEGALTTGNATLTGKIGAAAITDGAITIAQVASAAGDVDSATPSAAKTVAAGDVLSVTCGGTNDAVVGAVVSFLIET